LKDLAYEAILQRPDGVLNDKLLGRCWKQHQRGQRDWSALLWTVLMFKTWQGVDKAA